MESEKIQVSLRDSIFVFETSQLSKFPESRISKVVNDGFFTLSFDRKADIFRDMIVDIYPDDEAHIPGNICVDKALKELEYWGFDESVLSPCCAERVTKEREMIHAAETVKTPWETRVQIARSLTTTDKIYQFLEYPQSSKGALAWYCIVLILVIVSIICLAAKTVTVRTSYDGFIYRSYYDIYPSHEPPYSVNPIYGYLVFEWLVLIVLVVDYILRIVTSPVKSNFCLSLANLIDLIVLVPFMGIVFLTTLFLLLEYQSYDATKVISIIMLIAHHMNAFRALYILKLMAKFQRPRVLLITLRNSFVDILLVFIVTTVAVSIFSTLVYYSESAHEAPIFVSISDAMWLAIITLTTVGYGDQYPLSRSGKVFASCFALTGIVLIALFVSIVVRNYLKLVDAVRRKGKVAKSNKSPVFTKVVNVEMTEESGGLLADSKI